MKVRFGEQIEIPVSWEDDEFPDALHYLNEGDVFKFYGSHFCVAGPLRNDTGTCQYPLGSVGPFDLVVADGSGSYAKVSKGFGIPIEDLEAEATFFGVTLGPL